MSAQLVDNAYGKSQVRLTKVTRLADRHELKEIDVDIQLRGAFDACYTAGDNRGVLPTDTMKNTVYALAAQHPLDSVESFAAALAGHFLNHPGLAHCSSARVGIRESRWKRIHDSAGKEHPWSFVNGGTEKRTCAVTRSRGGTDEFVGGIDDLQLLKTTESAFKDFLHDPYTTLPDTDDRIFATTVRATWRYNSSKSDWNAAFDSIRHALMVTFAGHMSLSAQQTLLAMGEAAIQACGDIDEIEIWLPNQHRIPFNLKPLGLENRNEIFVTTAEPFGLIGGTVRRK
jgi:urate oxidase